MLDPTRPNPVWVPGKDVAGDFDGVVRSAAYLEPFLLGSDARLGPGGTKSMSGLSITVDTASCPPSPPN